MNTAPSPSFGHQPPVTEPLPSADLPMRLSAGHPWRVLAPGVDWDSPLVHRPLYRLFEQTAEAFPERPHLSFMGRRWTYQDSAAIIDRAAIGFQTLGVKPNTKVGLCLPNTPFAVWAYFAILKAGGTVVPLNPQETEHELFQQLSDTDCKMIVTLNLKSLLPKVLAVAGEAVKTIISCPMTDILSPLRTLYLSTLGRSQISRSPQDDRVLTWDEFLAPASENRVFEPPLLDPRHDLAVILHSTGASGLPKAVMLSHAALSANAEQLRRWFHSCESGSERFLAVMPFFHSLGMTAVQNLAIALGAELILLPRFDLDLCLRTISKMRPTVMVAIPAIYSAIATCPDIEAYDISSLRYAVCGGAPLPESIQNKIERLSGCRMVQGYGLTEAGPVTHCTPLEGVTPQGSLGLPLPGTQTRIRSLSPPYHIVSAGIPGELWVRGPQLMSGYWHRPHDSQKALVDGWLKTGDVAWQDEEGCLHFVGRLADALHVFDTVLYPQQLEAALIKHPSVREAICIPPPPSCEDPRPLCFASLYGGQSQDAAPRAQDLYQFISEQLPESAHPQVIEIWESLPHTSSGKIDRTALADYARDQLQPKHAPTEKERGASAGGRGE